MAKVRAWFSVGVGLCQGYPLSPLLFLVFIDSIYKRSQSDGSIRFRNLRIASLFSAEEVGLLSSSVLDLQPGMRISTTHSEWGHGSQTWRIAPSKLGESCCPKQKEFNYLRSVLFMNDRNMEHGMFLKLLHFLLLHSVPTFVKSGLYISLHVIEDTVCAASSMLAAQQQ